MLKLNPIGAHSQWLRSRSVAQRDIACEGLRRKKLKRFANRFIELDVPSLQSSLAEQTAQTHYHFARALVVALDFIHDQLDLFQVRRCRVEDQCRRLGVVENRAQWLIELVRNRRRQRAGGRPTIHMHQLRHSLA